MSFTRFWHAFRPPKRSARSARPSLIWRDSFVKLGARPPDSDADPQQEKRRIFFALGHVFSQLAARQPLLLILEDLHWADDTTLEVLAMVARRIPRERILLLGTYRNDEVSRGLGSVLNELDRSRASLELRLDRLVRAGVAVMLQAIFKLDRPVRNDIVDAIYALTEGNPFFVEELIRSQRDDARGTDDSSTFLRAHELRLPRSIQDAVLQRTSRVSPQAREVLVLAAVAGRRFEFELLQALTGYQESELLKLMKELIAAQLVVEEDNRGDQFAFRHALTCETVYQQLLGRERRGLHQRIAVTLEQLVATSHQPRLEDLAYHYSEAGVWNKALAYAERAGQRTDSRTRRPARRISIRVHLKLLDGKAFRRRGISSARGGAAHGQLGNFELARADHEAALVVARLEGDRQAQRQALMDLGFLWLSCL